MANYNKQFNFRNGVQVDDDNLVVNAVGLVGVGTTVPTENLDVRGNAKVSGFSSATSTFTELLTVNDSAGIGTINLGTELIGAGVSIRNGIITASDSNTGIITFFGDARFLSGMPTSQWIDIDAGLGFTSIYNKGFVGVATDDPRFSLQIGGVTETTLAGFGTGVGISSVGNVLISGITTSGTFVGIGSELQDLDANRISYGTISTERLPIIPNDKLPSGLTFTGVITATEFKGDFTGDVAGTASTALSLSGTPNIIVGVLTAAAVSASNFVGGISGDVTGNLTGTATTAASLTTSAEVDIDDLTVGVATVSTTLVADGNVGIGTSVPGTDLMVKREGVASRIAVISDTEAAVVSVGKSDLINGQNAEIRFGNTSGLYPYSSTDSFDLINHGKGNFNYYLDVSTVGVNTGNFFWHHQADDRLMTLTYEGNLGIGVTEPNARLHVGGGATFAGTVNTLSNVFVGGTLDAPAVVTQSLTVPSITVDVLDGNVNAITGVSTFSNVSIGETISLSESSAFTLGITTNRPGHLVAISESDAFVEDDALMRNLFIDSNGNIGIGTTASIDEIQIYAPTKVAGFGAIAIGNTTFSGAVDFSNAGTVTNNTIEVGNRYMVPPKLTTTERNAQNAVAGAMIYNTTINKLQVYTGSSWETITSA